jgi:hypothetical protein
MNQLHKQPLALYTFYDPLNIFPSTLQRLSTAIISCISQIICFAGSYIVVCISAAFLITTTADILKILGCLLIALLFATVSEIYYVLRNLGMLFPYFLYEFGETWLLGELIDGNFLFVAECYIVKILMLFDPSIQIEITKNDGWVYLPGNGLDDFFDVLDDFLDEVEDFLDEVEDFLFPEEEWEDFQD